jgi:pyrroline-5-carboxylate reductase
MNTTSIAFIGGGNMARSLIGGLIADGHAAQRIAVSDPSAEQRALLGERFGVPTLASNLDALEQADVLVIAVKPQAVAAVSHEIADAIRGSGKLVISIAAGIRTAALATWLGEGTALVRAMPNTPALVQSGATVLYATPWTAAAQRETAESVLRAVGSTLWIDDEELMDAVTALSGSGPAYFFLVMEAMEAAARQLGLPPGTARLLTVQTAFGAAKMALESADSPGELRTQVTSPGGTTERALQVLNQGDLAGLFERALAAARARSAELSNLLGTDSHAG